MKSAQKTSLGIVQLAPLVVIAILVLGGLVAFSPKSNTGLDTKLAVLKSESDGDSSDNSGPGSTQSSSDDDRDDEDVDEVEDEVEDEIEDEEELEVESGTEAAKIKIKVKKVNNRFVFMTREIEAETDFPLSVNPQTNELVVTTPAGEKVVTILPDQAVSNMLANNVFDREQNVNVLFENGTVIYRILGNKDEKLFGIFKVVVPTTAVVSANTGQLVTQEQPFLFRFVDLLSI